MAERQDPGQAIKDRALLARLDKPEDLKAVLAREQSQYDCLSCRVMGKYMLTFRKEYHSCVC